jgi:hypothetical protein
MSMWNGRRNGNHRRVLALALFLAGGGLLHATDLAVSGNLTVSGLGVIQGDSLQLGTAAGTPTAPGLIFTYVDTDSTHDQIGFSADRLLTTWIWQYNNSGTWEPQMGLDATNTLTIYDRASTPNAAITLNPTGTSTFAQSLTGNGTNNLLPNQTLTGAGSILTEGLGDARYLTSSNFVIAPYTDVNGSDYDYKIAGAATASGISTMAFGSYASAIGDTSTAIGYAAQAYGGSSVAIGEHAFAENSTAVALGSWCHANGIASYAFGYVASADNYGAMAFSVQSEASGIMSAAGGPGSTAQGYAQFAVGQNNIAQGTPGSWVATDDLFIVGNGAGNFDEYLGALTRGTSSNAFAVKKNGETSVFGSKLNFGLVSGVAPGAAGSTGARLIYADGTAGAVTFSASKAASTWAWQNNDTATTPTPQMSLSGSNVLTLYNSSGAAAIVLDPANPTAFAGISQTAADARYVSNAYISIGTALPGEPASMAFGYDASASGLRSVAIGTSSIASGEASSAIAVGAQATSMDSTASAYAARATAGSATASGDYALASGTASTATAYESIASGFFAVANGAYSQSTASYATASAYKALASGQNSTAAGANSTAAGYAQFVVGQYNDTTTNPSSATAWISTDDLFQIGNGTDATHTSNALTVKKNGDTTVAGQLTTASLVVNGASHIAQQGDLAMGDFTAGP